MNLLKTHIKDLVGFGKYFFTKQEVLSQLDINENQFKYQAYRLSKKKMIMKIVNDFFMIIPDEYRALGSLPVNWIIDPLMKYLKQDYYVGLLTAGSIYGATEQQPMTFQVITSQATRTIYLERIRIEFHMFKYCSLALVDKVITPTGYMQISKKEQTLIDLVRFYKAAGYLSNVALVIKSLAQECNYKVLKLIINREQNSAVLQRLGYILQFFHYDALAKAIEVELKMRHIRYVKLRSDLKTDLGIRDERWKLILNDTLELS